MGTEAFYSPKIVHRIANCHTHQSSMGVAKTVVVGVGKDLMAQTLQDNCFPVSAVLEYSSFGYSQDCYFTSLPLFKFVYTYSIAYLVSNSDL